MTGLIGFLSTYGVAAIFAGCLAEGETFAVAGGFLAHQGVLRLPEAAIAVFAGAFLGDLGFFLAGRTLSKKAFVRRLSEHRAFARASELIARHPVMFILTNRYVYGLRTVGGLAAGMSGVGLPLFMVLNALSAAVWAALFVSIGWVFGLAAHQLIGHLFATHKVFVLSGLGGVFVLGAALFFVMRRNRRIPTLLP